MSPTKKNKNKNNKTKKIKFNEKRIILTETIKPIEEVIFETKDKKINNELNSELEGYFDIHLSKKNTALSKNDFYTYINEIWLKNLIDSKKQMRFLLKLDDFRIVDFKTYKTVFKLIKDFIIENDNIVSTEVNNLVKSALHLNSIMSSKNYLNNVIKQIDLLRQDKNNLWKMLAFINKNEYINIFGPFCWFYLPDQKNSSEYISYLTPHQFAVFDVSIYENPKYSESLKNKYSKEYRKFFISYLKKLFNTTVPGDKSLSAEDVFDVGTIFFRLLGRQDKKLVESPDFYNKISKDESIKKFKFNWTEYCEALGYDKNKIPDSFIVSNLQYFKFCTEELLENWNSEKWRSYWIWIFARVVTRFTKNWHHIFFKFYGEQLEGVAESVVIKSNIFHEVVDTCAYAFNPLLNNLYIDYAYDEENIVFATNLANNLKNIFINKIKRNTWLNPNSTKKYAIFKVEEIDMEIGSKKIEGNYEKILPLLNYNPNEYLQNIFKVAEWRHNKYINGDFDIIKTLINFDYNTYPFKITNLPSYIVNAEYVLTNNTIKISTAYLQKPFIDRIDHGIEYNLAYLGFTIAHELSHALDDMGSKYDTNGNLNDWWDKTDKLEFKKIQNNIIKQYNILSKYDKLMPFSKLSVGEDIADISGINICEEYLRDYCLKNHYTPLITYLHFKMFYVYFAYQMKQKIAERSLKYELTTNPHSLDKYRTNIALSRSKLFKAMFNVDKNDRMYWDDKFSSIWD